MKPKRTILCVDDNEQSLSIRKVMLETRGYRVLAFSDSQQALNRFSQGGAKGMYAPADLLERIRLLLVRKRGPKRAIARTQVPPVPACRVASA